MASLGEMPNFVFYRSATTLAILSQGIYPREMESYTRRRSPRRILMAALLISQARNTPGDHRHKIAKYVIKYSYNKYYSAIKMDRLMILQPFGWISKICWAKLARYTAECNSLIPFIWDYRIVLESLVKVRVDDKRFTTPAHGKQKQEGNKLEACLDYRAFKANLGT